MEARAALIAANELLRYRPVDDLYEEWLDRVAELVRAARGLSGAIPLSASPSTSHGRRGSWRASTTSAPRRRLGT